MTTPSETAAHASVAAFSTLVMTAIGVDPATLLYAMCGAVFGASITKASGTDIGSKLYGLLMFVASSMICAAWATTVSDQFFGGSRGVAHTCAPIFAVCFHTLVDSGLKMLVQPVIEALREAIKKRIGG